MTQSFDNPKELRFVITLGTGSFAGQGSNNTITLEGYRAVVDIDKAGGMMMGQLKAQIFGVSQSDMNSCITYPNQPGRLQGSTVKFNTIQVFAVDGSQSTLVFTGNIIIAWGNYQSQPDVFLEIQAVSTYSGQLDLASPTSYDGPVNVATAMNQLATAMGLNFENNGVSGFVVDQYLPSSTLEQAKAIQKAADIWMYIDNGVMAITLKNTPRNKQAPVISDQTGLKGYPRFDSVGIYFDMLFNPSVIFGGPFIMQSDIPQANGQWIFTNIALKLESEKPNGAWFMTIRGTKNGLAISS